MSSSSREEVVEVLDALDAVVGRACELVRTAIILAATAAAIPLASPAHADPACRDSSDPACGGHSWNGPLQQTWDTPGYYGGMTGGNRLVCDPFTHQCRGVATP